jgi:hypothetical protein
MFDKIKIACAWKRADALAKKIWEGFCSFHFSEEAKKAQIELKQWLDYVRENGLVYNGSLDCYVTMCIWED